MKRIRKFCLIKVVYCKFQIKHEELISAEIRERQPSPILESRFYILDSYKL